MEYKQIQEMIKTINKSNISEFCVEQGDFKIVIKQDHTAPLNYVASPQMPLQQAPAYPAIQQAAPAAQPAAPASEKPAAPAAQSNAVTIKSPMIGTFYRSPSP